MKISSYSIATSPSLGDKLIGTRVGGAVVNGTFNFTIQQLSDIIADQIPLQKVLDAGNTATKNINLTGIITTTSLVVGNINSSGTIYSNGIDLAGNFSSSGLFYNYSTQTLNITNTFINGTFKDSFGSRGAVGQVLSSTFSSIRWIDLPATPNLQQVLNAGNTANQNMSVTGKIYFESGNESLDNFVLYDSVNGTYAIRYAGDGTSLVLQEDSYIGYVGIGRVSTSAKLEIYHQTVNDDNPHIRLTEPANEWSWGISCTGDDSNFVITDTEAANATRFAISKQTGNVLVGVGQYPLNTDKLQVSGNGYFINPNGNCNITIQAQYAGTASLILASQSTGSNRAVINSSLSTASLVLQTNSIDRVTIGNTGNVWIGSTYSFTSNAAKLEVNGYSYFQGNVKFDVNEYTEAFVLYNGPSGVNAIRYDGDAGNLLLQETTYPNNNVLIGASSSIGDYKLQVTGDSYFYSTIYCADLTASGGVGCSYLTVGSLSIDDYGYGYGLYETSGYKGIASYTSGTFVYGNNSLRIDANGSVLINQSVSVAIFYKLQVTGISYFNGGIDVNGYIGCNTLNVGGAVVLDVLGSGFGLYSTISDQSIATWDNDGSGDYFYGNGALRVGSNEVVKMPFLPTSSAGLLSGDLWRNGTVVNIVP